MVPVGILGTRLQYLSMSLWVVLVVVGDGWVLVVLVSVSSHREFLTSRKNGTWLATYTPDISADLSYLRLLLKLRCKRGIKFHC